MDARNFVGRSGTGYDVYVNGQLAGHTADQASAEQLFNQQQAGAAANLATGNVPTAGPGAAVGAISPAHRAALQQAGYGDYANPNLTEMDYARISAGAEAGAGSAGGYPTTGGTGFNVSAGDLAERQANDAAQQAYLRARLYELEIPQMQNQTQAQKDALAVQKARDAWDQTYQSSLLSGQFNGQPTEAAKEYAQNFGIQQAGVTGTYNGQPTEQAREFNTTATQNYLNQLASLRGPANAFQYAKVLAGTPGGLSDIVRSAWGQYRQPGFGAQGEQPIPVTPQTLINDVNTYGGRGPAVTSPPAGGDTGGAVRLPGFAEGTGGALRRPTVGVVGENGPEVLRLPAGSSVTPGDTGYTPTPAARLPANPIAGDATPIPTRPLPANPPPVAPTAAVPYGSWAATPSDGGGVTPTPPVTPPAAPPSYVPTDVAPLPPPGQINARNWLMMSPSQRDLLMAAYENAGWSIPDVQFQFGASLPRYQGPQQGQWAA